MNREELMQNVKNLIGRWGNKNKVILNDNVDNCKIIFYTNDHCYSIHAKYPKSDENGADNGYLGCIANTRKPLAGEDWNRGNDLADGGCGQETWHRILEDIIAFELVPIAEKRPDDLEMIGLKDGDKVEVV